MTVSAMPDSAISVSAIRTDDGNVLRRLRLAAGLKQSEVAERMTRNGDLRLDQSGVSRLERRREADLTMGEIRAFAVAVGRDADEAIAALSTPPAADAGF